MIGEFLDAPRCGPSEVLGSLAGPWLLRRSIDNGASMNGTATIANRGDGRFDYHERGELRLPGGHTVDGERRYIFAECDGGFSVLFAETPPRLFHRVVLRSAGPHLIGRGKHLCGEDRYDSRYEFHSDGSFVVEHAVHGPRKRYAITTRYSRQSPA
jgi:hypothetical protein